MAITVNTVTIGKGNRYGRTHWIKSATSADASGNEELVAAVTGKSHYLEKIRVDMCPGATAASFTINDAAAAVLGPIDLIDTGGTAFEHEFLRPVKFTANQAINIDTEAGDQIHVLIEGYTV